MQQNVTLVVDQLVKVVKKLVNRLAAQIIQIGFRSRWLGLKIVVLECFIILLLKEIAALMALLEFVEFFTLNKLFWRNFG